MEKVLSRLKAAYPDAHCELVYSNAYELLVATILSAQCTDKRVNMVTPAFFKRFPEPKALSSADTDAVETLIRSTGFYKNKAKSLLSCAKNLVEIHGGKVPKTLDALIALRGVGRKTANVVLGNAYGIPGLVVDTHVGRLTRRMGFTSLEDPVKIEMAMMEIVPQEDWTLFSHLLIFHGRRRCIARKPDCKNCEVLSLCPRIGVAK